MPELLQRIRHQHAQLGVGGEIGRAHRVGVELDELAEAPRPRLLVAPHRAELIAAERLGQRVRSSARHGGRAARSGRSAATATASSSSWNENTPSLGRSASGRNLPSASEYSKAGVSSGSKPYSSYTERMVDSMVSTPRISRASMSRMPFGRRGTGRGAGVFSVISGVWRPADACGLLSLVSGSVLAD